jgi:DNA-binding NarL/FixJ family response regulator
MDIQMPEMNGITVAKKALWEMHELKIIAITMYRDKAYLKELIEAGFKGCVFKSRIYDDLPVALERVMEQKIYYPDDILFN